MHQASQLLAVASLDSPLAVPDNPWVLRPSLRGSSRHLSLTNSRLIRVVEAMFLSMHLLGFLCLFVVAASPAMAAVPDQIAIHQIKQGIALGQGTARVSTVHAVRPLHASSGTAGTGVDGPTVSVSTGPVAPAPPPFVGSPLLLGLCNLALYTVPVQFPDATPATFDLALDTGSADIFVASDECDYTCDGNPAQFPTATAPGNQFTYDSLSYGSGGVKGVLFTANVSLGPSLPVADYPHILAMRDATFGLISEFSCLFDQPPSQYIDGLLGAGIGAIDRLSFGTNAGSIVDYLGQQGVPKVLTTLLCDLGGYLYVGGLDTQTISQAPSFTPLLAKDYPDYSSTIVNVTSITLDGQDVGLNTSTPWIVDTGTNQLAIQNAAGALAVLDNAFFELFGVTSFFSSASASEALNQYNINCYLATLERSAIDAAMPRLDFNLPSVGGGTFTVSYPATYSYIVVNFASDGTTVLCPNLVDITSAGTVSVHNFNVLPNNLMNNLEVIFDQVNGQIGFAVPDPTLCPTRFAESLPPGTPSPPPVQSPPPAAPLPPTAMPANASPPPPSAERVADLQPPPPTAMPTAVSSPSPPPPIMMPTAAPTAAPTTPGPVATPTPVASPTPTPAPVATPTPVASPTPTPHPARAPHTTPHQTPHAAPHRHPTPHPRPAPHPHPHPHARPHGQPHSHPHPHSKPHHAPHRAPHKPPHKAPPHHHAAPHHGPHPAPHHGPHAAPHHPTRHPTRHGKTLHKKVRLTPLPSLHR